MIERLKEKRAEIVEEIKDLQDEIEKAQAKIEVLDELIEDATEDMAAKTVYTV